MLKKYVFWALTIELKDLLLPHDREFGEFDEIGDERRPSLTQHTGP